MSTELADGLRRAFPDYEPATLDAEESRWNYRPQRAKPFYAAAKASNTLERLEVWGQSKPRMSTNSGGQATGGREIENQQSTPLVFSWFSPDPPLAP